MGSGHRRDGEHAEGCAWFERAALRHEPAAEYFLGQCAWHGRGTEQDQGVAFRFFQRAANAGYGPAWLPLAQCFVDGVYVQPDLALAQECFQKALGATPHPVTYEAGFAARLQREYEAFLREHPQFR